MALTRDYKQTIIERVERDLAFAKALLDEAATLSLNGEPVAARLTGFAVAPRRAPMARALDAHRPVRPSFHQALQGGILPSEEGRLVLRRTCLARRFQGRIGAERPPQTTARFKHPAGSGGCDCLHTGFSRPTDWAGSCSDRHALLFQRHDPAQVGNALIIGGVGASSSPWTTSSWRSS